MASAQVVETSVANNSPSGDPSHPVDHFQSRYVTPWFNHFLSKKELCDMFRSANLVKNESFYHKGA